MRSSSLVVCVSAENAIFFSFQNLGLELFREDMTKYGWIATYFWIIFMHSADEMHVLVDLFGNKQQTEPRIEPIPPSGNWALNGVQNRRL